MTNTKGFLNRNQLKYLVIAAMLIDHIAWAFVPTASLLGQVMHVIGRLTGPTMAYMLAEGYHYTRNVKKYAMRLGIFAVISWLPFSYFESGGIRPAFGVIYTLFLSLLAIWFWDKAKCSLSVKWLDIFGLCLLSVFGDWAIFDVLYALTFFISGEPQGKMAVVWRHYTGVLYECADIRTHVEWSVPVGYLSGDTADTVLLQRRRRQQKAVSQVVFLCVLSAAPVGAGRFAMGGVCVNVRILQKEKSTGAGI